MKKVIYIIFIIIIMLALNSTNIKAKDEDPGKYLPQVSKSSKEKGATSSSSSSSSTELKGTGTGGSSDLNLDALEKEINNVKGTDTTDAVNKVLGIARMFIVSAAVIVVIMKGVSFMQAAPEGKAEIKKQMINIVVGGVILFGINGIVGIIINVASKMF